MNRETIFAVAFMLMFCGLGFLPPPVYLFAGLIFFSIGINELTKNDTAPESAPIKPVKPIPPFRQPSAATAKVILPERKMPENIPADLKCPFCGASIRPTDRKCAYCASTLKPLIELPEPAKLAEIQVGQDVQIADAQNGPSTYRVRGRLLYTELWQASTGPTVPWTPTGNYFAGFALQPTAFLLNWQDRFYLFEKRRSLTDMDINRDFMPYARQFAQSNQTARVTFSLEGSLWQILDIGRFAIEFEDGEGLHLRKGAIGRFIHAISGQKALVLEDFQSGGSGGQDTLWLGRQINESDIKF